MQRPGPRMTLTPWTAASSAMAWPIFSPSSGSHELDTVTAVGKQVAGSDPLRPRWSAAPAWCLRPLGPSEKVIAGIPSRGFGLLPKVVAP